MKYLLDTCVLSELVKPAPDEAVLAWMGRQEAANLFTSAMTLAELLRGVEKLPASRRKKELSDWLSQVEADFESRILSFDSNTARMWARMNAQAQAQGKTLAALDAIIAATALQHQLHLVTRNVKDFAASSADLLNPWHAAR